MQQDIDYARLLISAEGRGPLTNGANGIHTIVVANCVSGKDGINRNYRDPKFPEWSWHVSQFLAFADITAEALDGDPTYTEYIVSNAPPGQSFEIGYWGYTVVQELGPAPLLLSITPEGQNFEFYWSAPGTNYVYTLEGSESPVGINWFAITGPSWPLVTNHWSLPRTNALAYFYRVRAEHSPPGSSPSTRPNVAASSAGSS